MRKILGSALILVSAAGYFVDVFDLVLFGVVRVESLASFGLSPEKIMDYGASLLNLQMLGMIFGGFFWGFWGDKHGRKSVLIGSILMYSAANLLNALITDVVFYGPLRFIAGFGLAGELGAAVTLVVETLPKNQRGLGTTLVATFGLCGAVCAALVSQILNWRWCYALGGGLGLALLFLRKRLQESPAFKDLKAHGLNKDSLKILFQNSKRIKTYLQSVLLGIPIWYVTGLLMVFAPEFAQIFHIEQVTAGSAILFNYLGGVLGDLACGVLSQIFASRKKVILGNLLLMILLLVLFFSGPNNSTEFYGLCFGLGLANGYFALFVTASAEQFGTNIRATVATTAPNLVRGAVVPLVLLFQSFSPKFGPLASAGALGVATLALALWAWWSLSETFNKNLDYHEKP